MQRNDESEVCEVAWYQGAIELDSILQKCYFLVQVKSMAVLYLRYSNTSYAQCDLTRTVKLLGNNIR